MDKSFKLNTDALEIVAGDRRLLSGLTFELQSGEALILKGPNGVGKTSLLAVLSGLTTPASGSVTLSDDKDGGDYDLLSNAHYLGHKNALKLGQTGRQNLEFFCRISGEDPREVDESIDSLKLGSLQSLPVKSLSAGQKRRLAFARLLISRRSYWLLDEPTSALDSEMSARIEDICHTYLNQGGMIIATSHLPFLDGPSSSRVDIMDLRQWIPEQRWVDAG